MSDASSREDDQGARHPMVLSDSGPRCGGPSIAKTTSRRPRFATSFEDSRASSPTGRVFRIHAKFLENRVIIKWYLARRQAVQVSVHHTVRAA